MTTRPQTAKPAAKRPVPPAAAKPAAAPAVKQSGRKMTLLRLSRKANAGQFLAWYKMAFTEKIHVIRSGVPAQRVGELSSVMDMPKEALMDSLGLSRATINRKVQREQALSPEESERVMGMQALIGQVQAMIDTESAPEFDAAKWLANWLAAPLPALGGTTPASFMDTVEGQKYVSNLLEMAQSGAYA
jgi:putative toxin-antitoxin system antitoxin component (TIGR02293 family)